VRRPLRGTLLPVRRVTFSSRYRCRGYPPGWPGRKAASHLRGKPHQRPARARPLHPHLAHNRPRVQFGCRNCGGVWPSDAIRRDRTDAAGSGRIRCHEERAFRVRRTWGRERRPFLRRSGRRCAVSPTPRPEAELGKRCLWPCRIAKLTSKLLWHVLPTRTARSDASSPWSSSIKLRACLRRLYALPMTVPCDMACPCDMIRARSTLSTAI
jgi:hypothetical protein